MNMGRGKMLVRIQYMHKQQIRASFGFFNP